MQKTYSKTPTQANYRVLDLIEQMVAVVPKGTALGLCDLISAMFSGYFIGSGGTVMPAVEEYLGQQIKDEKERAARSRRASKALTYGQYKLRAYHKLENTSCLLVAAHIMYTTRLLWDVCQPYH